jgi:tetratricopeptide (TPR) repeat protein
LIDFLTKLDNRQAIYWCKRQTSNEELPSKVSALLENPGDRVVNIPDFDGLMIELADIYGCPALINKKDIELSPIIKEAKNRAKQFQQQIDDYADNAGGSPPSDSSIRKLVSDWYEYQIKVDNATDNAEKERIYKEGIADTDHPYLFCNYANFLKNIKKDNDAAQKHYLKALEAEPNDADNNGNYAGFLFIIGNTKPAMQYLALAKDINKAPERVDLTLELAFYEYAHLANKRTLAEKKIIKLLEQGITSAGFDLSQHVEKAIKDGHPNIEALRNYAQRISAL